MAHELASLQESLGNSVYTVEESDVDGKDVAVFGLGPTGKILRMDDKSVTGFSLRFRTLNPSLSPNPPSFSSFSFGLQV